MKTALLIVDMVRDFTDPDGLVFYPENRKILPEIKEVLEQALGVPAGSCARRKRVHFIGKLF